MSKRFISALMALTCALSLFGPQALGSDKLRLGGTGAAQELLRQLGTAFAAQTGVHIELVPSLGSSGGISAVADDVLDVAVSGRPLKSEESGRPVSIVLTMRTPFVFATSHASPNELKVADIANAYQSDKAAWRDGTAMRVILRPRSESDSALLGELFPPLVTAIDRARQRPDVPLAATDQDNASIAEETPGSLVGSTLLQIRSERRNLRLITIDGVEPTFENFERGTYPYGKTLYFVTRVPAGGWSERFIAFLRSNEGQALMRQAHTR